jgi:hypothetical protein
MFKKALNNKFEHNDIKDCTLLHLAVLMNDNDALRILLAEPECSLDECADDYECYQPEYYCFGHITPLHLAVVMRNTHAVLQLLEAGAAHRTDAVLYSDDYLKVISPNESTMRADAPGIIFDNTPLHLAAIFNAEEIAKALIEAEADIHLPNSSNCSALDLALCFGHAGIEKALNEAGNSTDEERDSSFDL